MKKLFSFLTVIMTVLGLFSTTVKAASPTDTATLKITNIEGSPTTVTLYKIAEGEYNAAGDSFVKFKYAEGVTLTATGPTTEEIQTIAQGLIAGTITPLVAKEDISLNGATEFTKEVTGAGVYIALISGSATNTFNPILLAASYDATNPLASDAVSAKSNYLYGQTTVAKSSKPEVKKEITAGTVADDDKQTAGLGDKVDYKVSVVLPSYPATAINKTVFVSDTMSAGLTFDYASLTVKWGSEVLKADAQGVFTNAAGAVIGKAAKTENGFNLAFNYDNLATTAPEVTYSAIINDKAAVGTTGNTNNVEYFYSNNPNKGNTYDNPNDKPNPQNDDSITKKTDSKTVYTYQLAFKKVDSITKAPLANAVFGIYADREATKLIDTVKTNTEGYAISTKVGKGTYYIKEISAPAGYSLNTEVYEAVASWDTATTTTSANSTRKEYTSEVAQAINKTQVGWLKGDFFYAMDEFTAEGDGVVKAYLKGETTTADGTTVTEKNPAGSGTVSITDIPNTKLGKLPSTGGLGTYFFTFCGVLAMAVAAGLRLTKTKKAQ